MNIFLLGDFKNNNGPANANKKIKEAISIKFNVTYSKATNTYFRMYELIKGIINSDVLIICSRSNINYIAVEVSKFLGKKVVYLMHGHASYEAQIANPGISKKELNKIEKYESFVFKKVDRIVCVSKKFMEYMAYYMPQYESKLDYIYNVIDIDSKQGDGEKNSDKKSKKKILSVGGGLRRKNILTIAKAIDKYPNNIDMIVVGGVYEDGNQIKKYDFVTWIDELTHDELYKLMNQCDLYIQNSKFETFGLAVIEALHCGCSLLISKNVGCIDLFDSISPNDIIYNNNDENEIYEKIGYLLTYPNNARLMKAFQVDKTQISYQSVCWESIINKVQKGGNEKCVQK